MSSDNIIHVKLSSPAMKKKETEKTETKQSKPSTQVSKQSSKQTVLLPTTQPRRGRPPKVKVIETDEIDEDDKELKTKTKKRISTATSSSITTSSSSTTTKKRSKVSYRKRRLDKEVLNAVDMSGTLRSEWKVLEEKNGRISVAVESSPLWKDLDLGDILPRLL